MPSTLVVSSDILVVTMTYSSPTSDSLCSCKTRNKLINASTLVVSSDILAVTMTDSSPTSDSLCNCKTRNKLINTQHTSSII